MNHTKFGKQGVDNQIQVNTGIELAYKLAMEASSKSEIPIR